MLNFLPQKYETLYVLSHVTLNFIGTWYSLLYLSSRNHTCLKIPMSIHLIILVILQHYIISIIIIIVIIIIIIIIIIKIFYLVSMPALYLTEFRVFNIFPY